MRALRTALNQAAIWFHEVGEAFRTDDMPSSAEIFFARATYCVNALLSVEDDAAVANNLRQIRERLKGMSQLGHHKSDISYLLGLVEKAPEEKSRPNPLIDLVVWIEQMLVIGNPISAGDQRVNAVLATVVSEAHKRIALQDGSYRPRVM